MKKKTSGEEEGEKKRRKTFFFSLCSLALQLQSQQFLLLFSFPPPFSTNLHPLAAGTQNAQRISSRPALLSSGAARNQSRRKWRLSGGRGGRGRLKKTELWLLDWKRQREPKSLFLQPPGASPPRPAAAPAPPPLVPALRARLREGLPVTTGSLQRAAKARAAQHAEAWWSSARRRTFFFLLLSQNPT